MQPQKKKMIDLKKLLVEMLGTMGITFVMCWATVFNDLNRLSKNELALAYSFSTLVFIIFGFKISGGHFNPAITFSMAVLKKIELTQAIFYCIAQFLGAFVASGFIFIQMNEKIAAQVAEKSIIGIPYPGGVYEGAEFLAEMIGTFFITYVFMACWFNGLKKQDKDEGNYASAGISLMIYICSMCLGELSGGGFNPARSLGPALISGQLGHMQFVHLVSPIVGGILAAIIYNSIFVDDYVDDLEESRQEREQQEIEAEELKKKQENEIPAI